MPSFRLWRRPTLSLEVLERGVDVALHPERLGKQPEALRRQVEDVAKAVSVAPQLLPSARAKGARPEPVAASQIALRAANALRATTNTTPTDIEVALRRQGIEWTLPFAPGRPLTPYYGYSARPRQEDYRVGRNVGTSTRPDRTPFATLKQIIEGYDVALTCIRYIVNDLRSMSLRWGPMDGYEGDTKKDVAEAAKFWRRPDGQQFFRNWLAEYGMDVLRFDAGTLYRERSRSGKLLSLKVIEGTTIEPLIDYYADKPAPPAPCYQQFIQGIPWDWLTSDDLIYEPMWPVSESPFGVAPIETVLLNANTDVRLQLFFLNFFTEGTVPEMLIPAPKDMSDVDSIADLQETWDTYQQGNQAGRRGARFVPDWEHPPFQYKQVEQLDPKIAEYVMRRTVAAFGLTPQNLGILDDVNRATADTQTDQQFRVGTLPHVGHYEDIINWVTQEDLGLPVQAHFDTGREAEDRLMEAQAHALYVNMAAESTDEVRDKVLGLPVDNDNPVPRGYFSERLGFIPLDYLQSVSGETNPETYSPPKGTTPPALSAQPFVPLENVREDVPPENAPDSGGGAPTRARLTAPRDTSQPEAAGAKRIASPATRPERTQKAIDLGNWRKQSRARVAKGQAPREFVDSAIDDDTYAHVWTSLAKARTTAEVDAAFASAFAVDAAAHNKAALARSNTKHTGGMVSLDIPPGVLSAPSPEGEDGHHITVVFIGKDVDDVLFAGVCAVAQAVANATDGPLAGTVGGISTFPPSDSSDGLVPVFAIPMVPLLDKLRAAFEPFNASEHTDYRPHVTLAYADPSQPLPTWSVPETHIAFTHLSVHRGDEVVRYPFGGGPVQKASLPKAPARSEPGRPGPWGHLEAAIVTFWQAAILAALSSLVASPMSVVRSWLTERKRLPVPAGSDALTGQAEAFAAQLTLNAAPLEDAVRGMVTDAWVAGARDAFDQVANAQGDLAAIVADVDWSRWQPGHPAAADLLAGAGFDRLMAGAGVTLRDIDDITRRRIGRVLEAGVRDGSSVQTMAASLTDVLNDPARASIIAVTETNRAMSQATRQVYEDNHVPEWDLLTAADPCPECAAVSAANSHPMSDTADFPPLHPRCRCSVAAHV